MNLNKIKAAIGKRAPEILLVIGLTEVVATVIVASKATLRAEELLSEKLDESPEETLPPVEVIKTVGPVYIPTVIMLAGSITTICLSHHILTRRNATLAVMLSMAQSTITAYQDQILEKFGPRKLEAVRDDIIQKKIENNPPPEDMLDMNVPSTDGFMLCYDTFSDRYFRSSEDFIMKAFNRTLNPRINTEHELTYNDYCYEVGLKNVGYGDEAIWDTIVEPKFTYITYMGQPVCAVDFWIKPSGLRHRYY